MASPEERTDWPAVWVPSGESWVPGGAAWRVPDPQRRGRSGRWRRAWLSGFHRSNRTNRLARMKLKCSGQKGNSSRKGAFGSVGTPKLGKLSQVAAQPPRAVRLQSCCQWPLDPPSAVLRRHLPPPQPIVPADLGGASPHSTAVLGVRGGGGEMLTWLSPGRNLAEPRPRARAVLKPQPKTAPLPLLLPCWQTPAVGCGWLCLNITQRLD